MCVCAEQVVNMCACARSLTSLPSPLRGGGDHRGDKVETKVDIAGNQKFGPYGFSLPTPLEQPLFGFWIR